MSSKSESGVILLIVIILMLALTITGLAFLNAGVLENRLVRTEILKNQAFWLAEAGLERALWNLKEDFENGSEDWTDGWINGMEVESAPLPGDQGHWWRLSMLTPTLENVGENSVWLQYVFTEDEPPEPKKDAIYVRSTGTVENRSKTLVVRATLEKFSPWYGAIFAGTGAGAGTVINGNALIHGSVLILGDELEPDALAMDTTGTAGIRNNYEGMRPELVPRVPGSPETVNSLGAKLRVKVGIVGLSGTATVGEPDDPDDPFNPDDPFDIKKQMDGVYIGTTPEYDRYGGNKGAENVYSDNGKENMYNLPDSIRFPSLTTGPDPYLEYLRDHSLQITLPENKISSETLTFEPIENYDDVTKLTNSIAWDQSAGILTVKGIVYVIAESLQLGESKEMIEYKGTGTLVVGNEYGSSAGDIVIHSHLLAHGTYIDEGEDGFPHHALGLVANRIELATPGDAQLMMTGAFYAEDEIVSTQQNAIAGTFVSNIFDMGTNVPRIYEVPELVDNLPPGLPGAEDIYLRVTTDEWDELEWSVLPEPE